MGITDHTDDNAHVMALHLTEDDRVAIDAVLQKSKGSQLFRTIGDCGAEYR